MLRLKLQYFGQLMWRTDSLEKTLESPLDNKEIQPVHPKGNQSWVFIGRTDAEAEAPIPWPPDVKNWLIWKDPDAGKDWRQKEKGMTEDEMVGWHHWLGGHEFEQTPGAGDRQGSLACYSPRGHKKSGRIEWLNWTDDEYVQFCKNSQNEFAKWLYHPAFLLIHIVANVWYNKWIWDTLQVSHWIKNPPAVHET